MTPRPSSCDRNTTKHCDSLSSVQDDGVQNNPLLRSHHPPGNDSVTTVDVQDDTVDASRKHMPMQHRRRQLTVSNVHILSALEAGATSTCQASRECARLCKNLWNVLWLHCAVVWIGHLQWAWQVDPDLKAVLSCALWIAAALSMLNTTAGAHPLKTARSHDAKVTQGVRMAPATLFDI